MVKTAVLVSGGGKNLQSLIDARMFGEIPRCELRAVISSDPSAYALKRAEMAGLRRYIIDRAMFPTDGVFGAAVTDKLRDLDIELVVLAGFAFSLPDSAFRHFGGRIISTCPCLMPQFSEHGPEGEEICEAVLAARVRITGASAYFVTREPMKGPVILQRSVVVRQGDTPASLRARVLEEGENVLLPQAVGLFCEGRLRLEEEKVLILPKETATEKR